ncbi:MAG: hypothetical protein COA36_16325 [Desulfotalea sp.]|nr:MAG: hypothetical protein COA36_16325 [Desulfotalea sp.]
MNTILIIYQKKKKRQENFVKFVSILCKLASAIIIAWIPLFLLYEIPCKIGEHFDTDMLIVKTAQHAENTVTMKYRTKSYSLNKFAHELEEMIEFYSRI